MDWLLELDRQAFLAINGLHTAWLDPIMAFCSGKLTWIPLYLLILSLVWRRAGWGGLLWFMLGVAITILLADQLSVHLFKNTVQRLRPCHAQELQGLVYLPYGHCGGQYGFISSHACNCMAVALFGTLFARSKLLGWLLFLWAMVVSLSRVYMGVHYPGDVLCGAIFGLLVGSAVYFGTCRLRILVERRVKKRANSNEN